MSMKIGYFPPPSEKNSYTIRMKELLTQFGTVTPLSPKKLKDIIFKRKKFDLIIFNWLENRCFSKKGDFKIFSFIISMLWFHFMRLSSSKLIYVRHNIYPHNLENDKNKSLSIKIMDYFERKSDHTIVHSPSACISKRTYIPHPLYDLELNESNDATDLKNYFVCFGRIERYKKLHELIETWPDTFKLIIAGSTDDNEYSSELRLLSKNKNVDIIDRFLSDEDAYQLVKNANYSILPSNSESMIVSGSFFFSISAGTPVIAVKSDFYSSLEKNTRDLVLIDDVSQISEILNSLELQKNKLDLSFVEQFSDDVINRSLKKII